MSTSGLTTYRTATTSAVRSILLRYSLGIALLIAWQFAAMHAGSIFFPTPLEIMQRAVELWLSGPPGTLFFSTGVFNDILPSLARLLAGWSIAAIVGIVVGVAIGRSRAFSDLLDPSLQFLRAIPGPALIPTFLILLGTESTMRISLIAFGSVWPVLMNTIEGVRTIDPLQLETARAFRLPAYARLVRIILPAAMP